MKSGTTWLYRQLEQHPAIHFSPEKELHYLADAAGHSKNLRFAYRLNRFTAARARAKITGRAMSFSRLCWYFDYLFMPRTWRWYNRRFGGASPEGYCADFSNLTVLLGEKDWADLDSKVDEIRIVYVLRDPFDRIWSQLKSHYQASDDLEKVMTLESYLEQVDIREEDLLRHSLYAENMRPLFVNFDPKKIMLVSYEQILQDPARLLLDVENFLDIPPHHYLPAKLRRKINASDSKARPAWIKDHFYPLIAHDLQALRAMDIDFTDRWCP
ncbi:MAG: hypothetical protein ACJAYC_002439 [Halieaceae bacterium]|jgi:hypothetical protein